MVALATSLLLAAQAAAAQGTATRDDSTARFHVLPALGIQVGMPEKASAALGIVVGADFIQNGHDRSHNVALFAEPGLGAGRASIAYVAHGYGSFGSGFGIAATALRTWKDPWQVDANQTYVGGEVLLWPVVFVGPRIGLFRNVSSVETSKHWLVSLSFGIGL
jgi:hypothetical protein